MYNLVISFKEKKDWILETKYNIGKKRQTEDVGNKPTN